MSPDRSRIAFGGDSLVIAQLTKEEMRAATAGTLNIGGVCQRILDDERRILATGGSSAAELALELPDKLSFTGFMAMRGSRRRRENRSETLGTGIRHGAQPSGTGFLLDAIRRGLPRRVGRQFHQTISIA